MIVLDTHAWVWSATKPEKLPRRSTRLLQKADRIGVPAISLVEVATKAEAGKLRFDRPYDVWIEDALRHDLRIELVALVPAIAVAAARLSWDHRDPADRLIVATARVLEAQLVTADETIQESGLVSCVWD